MREFFNHREAEYVALGDTVKVLLFLRQMWHFMLPPAVFSDVRGQPGRCATYAELSAH